MVDSGQTTFGEEKIEQEEILILSWSKFSLEETFN